MRLRWKRPDETDEREQYAAICERRSAELLAMLETWPCDSTIVDGITAAANEASRCARLIREAGDAG